MGTDQEAVKDVVVAFEDCWNRHDMEAFSQLFAEDADFVNVIGLWWKGRSDIKQAHQASHATMFKDSSLTTSETSVRFLKPDVAVARTPWDLVGYTDPQGEPAPPRKGILTTVMVRDGDRWFIVASQNTDVVSMG